jgi:hypothetical protein
MDTHDDYDECRNERIELDRLLLYRASCANFRSHVVDGDILVIAYSFSNHVSLLPPDDSRK